MKAFTKTLFASVLFAAAFATSTANAWWGWGGPWSGGPWYGGYPGYGWGYPGYGWGYPGYGWGYPGYGLGYPGYGWGYPGYGWGHPGYGWGTPWGYAAPTPQAPKSSASK